MGCADRHRLFPTGTVKHWPSGRYAEMECLVCRQKEYHEIGEPGRWEAVLLLPRLCWYLILALIRLGFPRRQR